MSDIDEVVARAVNGVTTIAGKAAAFSTRLLLGAIVVCVGGFLLGYAALSGGIQTVWIVLGIVFGTISLGCAFVARWRVGSVRRHVPELADEVRSLIAKGDDTSTTIIETFTVDGDGDGDGDDSDDQYGPTGGSSIVLSRQMYGFKGMSQGTLEHSARLTAAVRALTTFPILVLATVAISCVFGFLGLIFLIALAL